VAGHEFGGDEEHDGVGDVLRTASFCEWGALDEIGLPFGRIAGHGDGAGSDGVDANFGGELLSENASEKNDTGFGNGVRKKFAPAHEAADIGEIDDNAVARLHEIGRGRLAAEKRSLEIGIEGSIPGGFGSFAKFGFEEIGGAVDEDIEAVELFGDTRKKIVNLLDACEVGLDSNGAATEPFDFVDDFEGFFLRIAVMDSDVGTFGGETKSDGAAKALPCPSDEGDAVVEGGIDGHGVRGLGKGSTRDVIHHTGHREHRGTGGEEKKRRPPQKAAATQNGQWCSLSR
jgi:hypothetical protein